MKEVTKRMFLSFIILSILFIFAGCPKEDDEPDPTTPPGPLDSISIDFESDTAGTTTYDAMGWAGVQADVGSVVTIESITAGDGLPANGDSVNVLLVEPTDYNEICKFPVTIPAGSVLGDYSTVTVDAYFPRNTLGFSGDVEGDNYYKPFIFEAAVTLSGGAQTTDDACMDYIDTEWNDVDAWKTFTFNIDSASTLAGDIEIALGISRPADAVNDDGYYLDNISINE